MVSIYDLLFSEGHGTRVKAFIWKNTMHLFWNFSSLSMFELFECCYFDFLKNVLRETWKAFNTKFGPYWRDWEGSYQLKTVSKALVLQKLSSQSNLKGSGAS